MPLYGAHLAASLWGLSLACGWVSKECSKANGGNGVGSREASPFQVGEGLVAGGGECVHVGLIGRSSNEVVLHICHLNRYF